MTTDIENEPVSRQPRAARATFSTDDFRLLRAAVAHYLQRPEVQDGPDSMRYGSLYHRLGRTG